MARKMAQQQIETAQKVADTLAASSAGLFGVAWIANVEPYVTVGAGLVAIVAGLSATWYHIERAILMHRKNAADRLAEKIDEMKEELQEIKSEVQDNDGDD